MNKKTNTINVLLVEDDEIDVESVKRAFAEMKLLNPIWVAKDGVEALEFLRGENGREKIPEPLVVLLDINMPRMNGFEFLDEIRTDDVLKHLVVFITTTSASDEDMMRAYNKNIAGYMIKSNAGDGFLKAVEMLECYWRVVELPRE